MEVLSVILSVKINGGTVMDGLAAMLKQSFVWYPSHSKLSHPGWWEVRAWGRGWNRREYNKGRRAMLSWLPSCLG